jgi:ornithine cyclodeaminase/alanine dehydrogenase-like protein (mu-crystallin family)
MEQICHLKQILEVLEKTDTVDIVDAIEKGFVADSIDQSQSRGEIFQARKAGVIDDNRILELGIVIKNKELQRTSDEQITVADLTGVAVQDIQICKIVSKAFG